MTLRLRDKTHLYHEIDSRVAFNDVQTKTADATLTPGDSHTLFIAESTDLVFTLPPTRKGLVYTFFVLTTSSTTGLSVSPNASDRIQGNGFTAADDKDAINSAGSDATGDLLQVVGDGTDGWLITNVIGTWAREA